MNGLQFILFKKEGLLLIDGKLRGIASNHMVVVEENSFFIKSNQDDIIIITCYPVNLLPFYQELISPMICKVSYFDHNKKRFKILPVDNSVIESAKKLMEMDMNLPLCFLYLYCLGADKQYFSDLLHQFIGININDTLLDFFEKNYHKQWPVTRYAQELELSVHKLNSFFIQQYGMPVKKWLIEKRLKKGGELLLTSTQRVADIALQCGFCNHAHFSALFRRHFHMSPSLFRTRTKKR
ncbi:AraC family transcriptional regulator [Acerihabitans sp. TG2]|uniref:helix-turn-helix domain-containing protein n=1 Tax=Acerihabitans sp. TG2 TaxID=3096008 RepID=UPI002B235026|nr:AraC family transcriptional regulator [Acerihabitans sp. TG2]MEA9393277.1 AraC family transcriptional regulator [Acerihabitans sp. TG2]